MDQNDLQGRSDEYWKRAQTTYLASAEYYDRQEVELRDILGALPRVQRMADVGCGDGRYTLVARDFSDEVFGWDISGGLVDQARRRALDASVGNLTFDVGSFAEMERLRPFGTVLCMGVLSAIFTDWAFTQAVKSLRLALPMHGTLVTKETLSLGEAFHTEQGDYVAFYRSKQTYVRAFERVGFTLREQRELTKATEKTQNSFYVFAATPWADTVG